MRELIQNVIQWANDRNIIQGSTAIKQLDKTSEELNELQRAIAGYDAVYDAEQWHLADKYAAEIEDAYGDVLVTLIIAAAIDNINLEKCLGAAYEVIRHRKGKLVNGLFIKEIE